jgi:integrase
MKGVRMRGCRGFTEKEIKLIVNYQNGKHTLRNKALVLLGIATGMRIGELLSLKISDVLNKNGNIKKIIHIKRANVKMKVEGASFELPVYAIKALQDYIDNRSNVQMDEYLFKSQKKCALKRQQAYQIIKKMARDLGLDGTIGTHSLRKTFAMRVYTAFDGNYYKCQKALRHKAITSTVSYIPVDDAEIQKVLSAMPLY